MVMYKNKEEAEAARLARENAPKNSSKIIYNKDTGAPTGIVLPNGKEYLGRSASEINFLARKYSGVPGTQDYNAPQQNIQIPQQPQNINQKPLISPEQINMVGTGEPNFVNTPVNDKDELTSDILEKQRQHEALNNPSKEATIASTLVAGPAGYLASKSGITFPDIINIVPPIGKKISNAIGANNPQIKDFLNDYSNEDNYATVKTNIATSEAEIKAAIAAAEDPRYARDAMFAYEEAMNRKRRSMEQLKILSKDQHEYVTNVRNDLTILETYFSGQQKRNDDNAIRAALNKANIMAMEVSNG